MVLRSAVTHSQETDEKVREARARWALSAEDAHKKVSSAKQPDWMAQPYADLFWRWDGARKNFVPALRAEHEHGRDFEFEYVRDGLRLAHARENLVLVVHNINNSPSKSSKSTSSQRHNPRKARWTGAGWVTADAGNIAERGSST